MKNIATGDLCMEGKKISNSTIINGIALGFSVSFLISSLVAAIYTGELGSILHGWYLIMTSPSPLVTDYLEIGGLPSAMLNAGACGMACWLFMVGLKGLLLRTELFDHVAMLSGPVSLSSIKEAEF